MGKTRNSEHAPVVCLKKNVEIQFQAKTEYGTEDTLALEGISKNILKKKQACLLSGD